MICAEPDIPMDRSEIVRPPRPRRKDPAGKSEGPSRRALIIILAAFCLFAFFVFAMIAIIDSSNHVDTREVRQYGNLQCIYNVTRDRVEACTEAGR